MEATLEIRSLRLWTHLGCGAEERTNPQEVEVSLTFKFGVLPKACVSDRLEETICYAVVSKQFLKRVEEKEYALVEHLAQDLFDLTIHLVSEMKPAPRISLCLTKLHPPVPGITAGVAFTLSN